MSTKTARKGQTEGRDATAAAPVASTDAASTAPAESSNESTGETADPVVPSISAAKPAKEPKKPSFEPNTTERDRLLGMSNLDLRGEAGDRIPTVGANDHRIFGIDDSKGLTDQLVGSPLERSGIRAAVIAFLRSRVGENAATHDGQTFEAAAPGWAIASFMAIGSNVVYRGKFDQGYLAARGNDVRRGMVARKQLRILAEPAPVAKAEPTAESPAAE